jgi:hypothetical protein
MGGLGALWRCYRDTLRGRRWTYPEGRTWRAAARVGILPVVLAADDLISEGSPKGRAACWTLDAYYAISYARRAEGQQGQAEVMRTGGSE